MGAEAVSFPAWTEADWRKAAEAALKGASLDKLITRTADGLRVEPVYQPGSGPRALRGEGAWRVIARLDHPDAREANAQALEDLSGGADGLQVVFAGAIGAYGFGLRRSDPETLALAFDNVQFDAGTRFELDLGPNGPAEALAFARPYSRQGGRARDQRGVVRSRSLRRSQRMDPFRPTGRLTSSPMSKRLSN